MYSPAALALGICALAFFLPFAYFWAKSRSRVVPESDLDRIERDNDLASKERQLARAFSRIGDLEDRVARLEDPYGKRKRGRGIYETFEGAPGLKELDGYVPPMELGRGDEAAARIRNIVNHSKDGLNEQSRLMSQIATDASTVDPMHYQGDIYLLGDDGELRKDNAHD